MNTIFHPGGIYGFLRYTDWPIFLVFLFMTCYLAIYLIRWKTEGRPYNIAMSSVIGIPALIFAIHFGIFLLRKHGLPVILNGSYVWIILALSVASGPVALAIVYFQSGRNWKAQTYADLYHNAVVVPVMIFFLFTLVPVAFINGTWGWKIATAILIGWFIALWRLDVKAGRHHQTEYLRQHPDALEKSPWRYGPRK